MTTSIVQAPPLNKQVKGRSIRCLWQMLTFFKVGNFATSMFASLLNVQPLKERQPFKRAVFSLSPVAMKKMEGHNSCSLCENGHSQQFLKNNDIFT